MTTKESTGTATTRLQRGIHLAASAEIVQTGPDTYRVPGSDGEAVYTVDLDKGKCSCPDRAPLCKHRIAAQIVDSRTACRRRRSARHTDRRHAESLKGVVTDLGRLEAVAQRVGVA